MTTFAVNSDIHRVDVGGNVSWSHRHLPGRQAGVVVESQSEVGISHFGQQFLKPRIGKNRFGSRAHLFGRLPDEENGAFPIVAILGQQGQHPYGATHMQVMTTSVHHAFIETGKRESGGFGHRESVHVGTIEDDRTSLSALEQPDYAVAAHVLDHFKACGSEFLGQTLRGFLLLFGKLRMAVEPAIGF